MAAEYQAMVERVLALEAVHRQLDQHQTDMEQHMISVLTCMSSTDGPEHCQSWRIGSRNSGTNLPMEWRTAFERSQRASQVAAVEDRP
jgi:hypothetical protein